MDHLIYPGNPATPPLHIPFLCDNCPGYDNLDFCSYPQRQGWASSEEPLAWLACGEEQLAKRAQTWLYFGTLSEFVGTPILLANFRSSTGYISTKGLRDLLRRRYRAYQTSQTKGSREADQIHDKAALLLKEAMRLSELLEQQVNLGSGTLALVSCSVKVLLQELGSAKYPHKQTSPFSRSSPPVTQEKFVSDGGVQWTVNPPKAIQYQMSVSGWCPAQICFLSQKYSCTALYYVSGLCGGSGVNHDQCTMQECTANNIDERTYQPRHLESCRKCESIGSSATHIASIIASGDIPVVSCSYSSAGRPQLDIVPATAKLRYIAISHVWSGGLGNPHENTIPMCQFVKLMQLVENLLSPQVFWGQRRSIRRQKPPICFWLDTLCIPVGESMQNERRTSIDKMAKIYAGAVHVLVLDVELQKTVVRKLPAEQALALILGCSWMFRCWTLQEATLAQSCYVQFKDKAVPLRKTSQDLQISITSSLYGKVSDTELARVRLVEELSCFLTALEDVSWQRPARETMWCYKKQETHQAHAFASTWNNFLGRFTTKMDDIHLMIAGMQDFKVSPVRDLPSKDRMKAILKGHAMLPLSLLYVPGARLDYEHPLNRWAPALPQSNQLNCSLGYIRVFSDCLLLMDNGSANALNVPDEKKLFDHFLNMTPLQFLRYALLKTMPSQPPARYMCLTTSLEVSLYNNFTTEVQYNSSSKKLWIEALPFDGETGAPARPDMEGNSKICILFPNIDSSLGRADWYETRGARLRVRKWDGSSLHLIYDCPLRIFAYDRRKSYKHKSSDNLHQSPHVQSFPPICSLRVPLNQRIFIDCDLSCWPSVPYFFTSPEGPFYSQATGHIYLFGYLITQMIWLPSFVIVLAAVSLPEFQMQGHRLPPLYVYICKVVITTLELLWWRTIWKRTERIAWSEEFGSAAESNADSRDDLQAPTSRLRYYDILNQEPSLLLGLKRILLMLVVVAVLLVCGFSSHILTTDNRGWARWAGFMTAIELSLRAVIQIAWLKLPGTAMGMWIRRRIIRRHWPWIREKLMKAREAHVKKEEEMERREFREGVDDRDEALLWG